MGGSFDKEACWVQAHGVGQLQAGKPRVRCSGGGGVEHVSGDGRIDRRSHSCLGVRFSYFDRVLHRVENHTAE